MTNHVQTIIQYHQTRSFGNQGNLIARSKEANLAYHALSESEMSDLIEIAFAEDESLEAVFVSLACLHPGSLKPFHKRLIEKELFYPAVIYHEADAESARIFADFLLTSEDTIRHNHLLLCMAWAGNGDVQSLFNEWRESPPAWVAGLFVPPHAYANEAGWELTADGKRRDLFIKSALPLVNSSESSNDDPSVKVGTPTDQRCPWCDRQMVALLDIDLTSDRVSFMGLGGRRLRVTTCDICSCYGTIFSKNENTGKSSWHSANVRPAYLPDNTDDWDAFPERPLILSGKQRHFMESASWTYVPGIAFSQIGGLPTWVQDAEYPNCPECSQKMLFIGQISNEDFNPSLEGIQYCFACTSCNVTATSYQQS